MVVTDPIADLLTRIRNAQIARHDTVAIPSSKIKKAIAENGNQQWEPRLRVRTVWLPPCVK